MPYNDRRTSTGPQTTAKIFIHLVVNDSHNNKHQQKRQKHTQIEHIVAFIMQMIPNGFETSLEL